MGSPPPIAGLLETALYVADMDRAARFFADVLGLRAMVAGERLTAFDAGSGGVLLLFHRGASLADVSDARGTVPGHDGAGPLHMAFRVAAADLPGWRDHLIRAGVPLRGEMAWAGGARSLYFEDPDSHLLELATPGLWPNDPEPPGR